MKNSTLLLPISSKGVDSYGRLNQGNKKEKTQPARPWVGTFFGIPEPEEQQATQPSSFTTIEVEIHILLKSLEVEKHTLSHSRRHASISAEGRVNLGLFDPEDLGIPLMDMAFKNEQALAFIIYFTHTDSRTNIRRELDYSTTRWIKNGRYTWQWVNEEGEKGEAFVPDVVKVRHPHAFPG